jgi:hypothetical protein
MYGIRGACYGRSTVVSDLDVEGFVLNVDGRSRQELDYNEVRTTEQRDKHTRGECMSSTREDRKAGTLQSMQLGPSDTRSQSYRLLAKLSSLIY